MNIDVLVSFLKKRKDRKKKTARNIIIFLFILVLALVFMIKTYAENENTYEILVDVEESKLWLFKNKELEKEYRCSGGKETTPSPIGTWKIISKGKWGEGFGGSWLGINVPWGKFGIHGTIEPYSIGWNSSHGCIRMKNEEVAELYRIVPIGTKVTIVDGVYGDFGKGFRYLKSGMYGADVKQIQERLKELGFFHGEVNGKFEGSLEEAVKAYCKANNLSASKTITPELQKHMGFYLMD